MLGLGDKSLVVSIDTWREDILRMNLSMFSDQKLAEFERQFDEWKNSVLKGHKDKILEKMNALEF